MKEKLKERLKEKLKGAREATRKKREMAKMAERIWARDHLLHGLDQ